jgi:hypothetical protein
MKFLRSFFRILASNLKFLGGGRGPDYRTYERDDDRR